MDTHVNTGKDKDMEMEPAPIYGQKAFDDNIYKVYDGTERNHKGVFIKGYQYYLKPMEPSESVRELIKLGDVTIGLTWSGNAISISVYGGEVLSGGRLINIEVQHPFRDWNNKHEDSTD